MQYIRYLAIIWKKKRDVRIIVKWKREQTQVDADIWWDQIPGSRGCILYFNGRSIEGAKAIFPKVVVQRCMVHLIRNSIKYVPSKDYKVFTSSLKKAYGAPTLKACKSAFETFRQQWSQYPGVVGVWVRNFQHVEQLYDYGASIRKIMYTTKKALSRMKTPCLKYYIYEWKSLIKNGHQEMCQTSQW